ncbi:hypothetical protein SETIT_8G069700v2 [Setaria italica]|uniref:Uncharacterized protein n=1 Tax=Setaria italica TaxID=4555 RepID=A0A368S6P7_SETIT|nr:hypothetical protein SETIT_8G069700v2 [Setaria italica]
MKSPSLAAAAAARHPPHPPLAPSTICAAPTSARVEHAYPPADSQRGWRRKLEASSAAAHSSPEPKCRRPIGACPSPIRASPRRFVVLHRWSSPPPLERGCRCVSYTPAQAHLCPKLDAGVAAAHRPSAPRLSGWRSRRSTAELAHAGPKSGSCTDPARTGPAAPCYDVLIGWLSIGGSGEIEALGAR